MAFLPVAIAFQEFGGPSRLAPNFAPPSPRSADIAFASGGCKAFALSLFYSQKMQEFAAGQAGPDMCWRNLEPMTPVLDAVITVEPKERISEALIKEIRNKISISRAHI